MKRPQPKTSSSANKYFTHIPAGAKVEAVMRYARATDLYGWKARVLDRLRAGNYHAAVLLCRQAALECLKKSGPASRENHKRIRELELQIESLLRD